MAARRGAAFLSENKGLDCPNGALPPIEGKQKNQVSSNARKSILSATIKDRHKRAARMLGYVLTADNRAAWAAAALVWEARLDPAERYDLARSVMLAMRPEDNEALVADLLGGAGYPLPTFLDPLDDAQWWADLASPAELRAYALAAFMAMPQRDRADFLEYVQGVTA